MGTEGTGDAPAHRGRRASHALDTLAVHSGDAPDLNAGAVVPPIYQTTTFRFPAEFSEAREKGEVHLYTRHRNPSQSRAAEAIATLEGAEAGRVFSSGMAALSSVFFSLLRAGDEVVALEDLYGNTFSLLRELSERWHLSVRWVRAEESASVDQIVTPKTRLLLLESPTNPTLRVHDLDRWARAAAAVGAPLVVDNTFATPVNQRPLAHGATLVMHSATKYLGGHSDVIAGALVGSSAMLEGMDTMFHSLGGSLDPFAAFLLSRGIKTVGLRVHRQNETGRAVAEELARHPRVGRVCYPGSASAEEERIAARQMSGRGGMVSIVLQGGAPAAHRFMHALTLVQPASSLGGVESLASVPAETSHRQLTPEERQRRGIDDGMVRLSFGIEDPADLLADLREALRKT